MTTSQQQGTSAQGRLNLTVKPTASRRIFTREQAEMFWKAGVNFELYGVGGYISRRDTEKLKANGFASLTVADNKTSVWVEIPL